MAGASVAGLSTPVDQCDVILRREKLSGGQGKVKYQAKAKHNSKFTFCLI